MTATADKKRPGRKPAKNPRNAYLNIRVKPEELDNLRAHAARRGIEYSQLVRQQLGTLLTRAPKGAKVTGERPTAPVETTGDDPRDETPEPSAPAEPTAETQSIDLAVWVANRVGLPIALARAHIGNGRIWVDGEVCRDPDVELKRVKRGVCFDGQPI